MPGKKLGHITELDGLRGMAVLMVMFYHFMHVPELMYNRFDHAFTNFFLGGWVGVDLFFVLSGFLITRILLHTKDSKSFFLPFYFKRSVRIFPLYTLYLVLSFYFILPYMYDKMNDFEQHKILIARESQAWFWVYLSNIKQMLNGTFFGACVGHLWSLAIEEQFYVIWPFIIYFLPARFLKKATIGIIAGALILRIIFFLLNFDSQMIYVFTFTRIDSIAMGSLVAILLNQGYTIPHKKLKKLLVVFIALSALILYTFGPRAENSAVIYTIGFSVFAITFGLMIVMIHSPGNFRFSKIFSNKVLVFFGKYSYALYIFHPIVRQLLTKYAGMPKIILGTQVPWDILFMLSGCLISVLVALLSWNLFEVWFLKLKKYMPVSDNTPDATNKNYQLAS